MPADNPTFDIPEWELEFVLDRLRKLSNRAGKKGLSPCSWTVGEAEQRERSRSPARPHPPCVHGHNERGTACAKAIRSS